MNEDQRLAWYMAGVVTDHEMARGIAFADLEAELMAAGLSEEALDKVRAADHAAQKRVVSVHVRNFGDIVEIRAPQRVTGNPKYGYNGPPVYAKLTRETAVALTKELMRVLRIYEREATIGDDCPECGVAIERDHPWSPERDVDEALCCALCGAGLPKIDAGAAAGGDV